MIIKHDVNSDSATQILDIYIIEIPRNTINLKHELNSSSDIYNS